MKEQINWKAIGVMVFLILLALSFVAVASAVAPADVQTNINVETGLEIEFTQVHLLENGKHHLFNAHVFNISTQKLVTNLTTDCNFHLFDNKGEHIINQVPMSFDAFGLDFELNATGGNFTRNGGYSYLIVCNTTNIGGFISVGLEVTQTGFEFTDARAITFTGFLFILVFLFIVNMGGIAMLPSRNNTDDKGNLISINNLKYLRSILCVVGYGLLLSITFLSSNVALAYLGTTLFGNILFVIFQVLLVLALPMFVIWLMYILSRIFRDREVKKMIERGVGGGV